MRAKFKVTKLEDFGSGQQLCMNPVCADKFGPNGESEDNDFARYTPNGELTMTITNPDLFGKLIPGEKYYLDFTKAE
jgi:hypothetical protein